jgi:hypothetical protein
MNEENFNKGIISLIKTYGLENDKMSEKLAFFIFKKLSKTDKDRQQIFQIFQEELSNYREKSEELDKEILKTVSISKKDKTSEILLMHLVSEEKFREIIIKALNGTIYRFEKQISHNAFEKINEENMKKLKDKYKTSDNYLKSILDGLSIKDEKYLSELTGIFPELEDKHIELRLKKYQDNERKKTSTIKKDIDLTELRLKRLKYFEKAQAFKSILDKQLTIKYGKKKYDIPYSSKEKTSLNVKHIIIKFLKLYSILPISEDSDYIKSINLLQKGKKLNHADFVNPEQDLIIMFGDIPTSEIFKASGRKKIKKFLRKITRRLKKRKKKPTKKR